MLGDDEGLRGEKPAATLAAEEAKGGEILLLGGVGGVEEDKVDGVGQFCEALQHGSGSAVFDGDVAEDFERG